MFKFTIKKLILEGALKGLEVEDNYTGSLCDADGNILDQREVGGVYRDCFGRSYKVISMSAELVWLMGKKRGKEAIEHAKKQGMKRARQVSEDFIFDVLIPNKVPVKFIGDVCRRLGHDSRLVVDMICEMIETDEIIIGDKENVWEWKKRTRRTGR